ncbi:MAG: hypothetical protein CL672_06640 [Balneola sp.]|nr:hypothetical protein [Balneola sp.]|tara:strand:+ start:634 stop:1341 length:708 start_codon:yes stop_codon:yes gene_type:complete
MSSKQLLKLVFFHDQRMEELTSSNTSKVNDDILSFFTKPDPTYSRLFFMGSDLANNRYGINFLDSFPSVVSIIERLYTIPPTLQWSDGQGIRNWIDDAPVDAYLRLVLKSIDRIQSSGTETVISVKTNKPDIAKSSQENAWGYEIEPTVLHRLLMKGEFILVKRAAFDGYDIDLFSKQNSYIDFFYPLQSLLPGAFRFFSINGKRIHNKEALFFEQTRLHKPPHGFEEVHPESVL